jgi:hypothetical protein
VPHRIFYDGMGEFRRFLGPCPKGRAEAVNYNRTPGLIVFPNSAIDGVHAPQQGQHRHVAEGLAPGARKNEFTDLKPLKFSQQLYRAGRRS